MNKKLIQNKYKFCYLLAFLLPVIFMTILSVLFGFYPFGKLSVLVADLRYQFVDYYGYLKNIYFGNDTYFYTFSKTFGGEMLGFASYYLNNPFALLLLFVPNDKLPAGILLMMIISMGFCGLHFNLLVNKVFGPRWASLIFSTAYAFMGFSVAYFGFTIYYFNILILPLIILGLYNMVRTGKISYLYIITLFLSVLSNYYMGYMTCLFSLLFFLYLFLSEYSLIKSEKRIGKTIGVFAVSSVLSVGLLAWLLFAVIESLKGQKSSGLSLNLSGNFRFADVFSGFYSTAFHGNISDGLPIIYCGMTTVVFLLLYFMNRKIDFKEKIYSAGILLCMLFSFWIDAANVAWHGFSHPIGFPYRNSFLFSFLVLLLAYKGFLYMRDGLKLYHAAICLTIFMVYSLYLLLTKNAYAGKTQIIVSGAVFMLTLVGVYGFHYKKEYKIPIIAGFFMLQAGDLLCNGYLSIETYFPDRETDESCSIEAFSDFIDETTTIVDQIEAQDSDFYRIDKMYRRTHNDAMMIGYNGLSHFSSCETEQVKQFMGNMGFRDNGNWAFFGEGSTSFADCFMGLKYMISQYDETAKPYQKLMTYQDKYVYQNPFALSLAFGTTDAITEVSADTGNHFEYQNALAESFSGDPYDIYRPVLLKDIKLVNVEEQDHIYKKIDQEQEGYIEYQFSADSSDFIYMYFDAPSIQDTTIVINDLEKASYFSRYGWSIREVGHFNPGELVRIRVYLNQEQIEIDNYEFYYEDETELANWYQDAEKTTCQIQKNSSSHLIGTINAAEGTDLIVFSIPYDTNWNVKIDGNTVKTKEVLDCLMAADITSGTHTIEMRYIPSGFLRGLPVSLLSFLILVVIVCYEKRKKKAS